MAETLHFIEQLLKEAGEKKEKERVEMNKLYADDMLQAVATLDTEMAGVNELCEREIARIESFRQSELSRLDKKRSWLIFNLDAFARESGEKTIRLPHGILKLRKGRDKIVIAEMEEFLKVAPGLQLLKQIPESFEPDVKALMMYRMRNGGRLPSGCEFIPAETRFSYTTTQEEESDGTDTNETERAA